MKIWKTKVLTVDEFKKFLMVHLLHDAEGYSREHYLHLILESGFPKFNIEDLGNFMKGLQCRVFLPPVCVDFGDSMFYWLVCGTSAILVNKEFDKQQT